MTDQTIDAASAADVIRTLVREQDEQRAKFYRMPSLPEAEARRRLLQVAAKLARAGMGSDAIAIRDAVDGWAASLSKRQSVAWSFCPLCGVKVPRPGRHEPGCVLSGEGP